MSHCLTSPVTAAFRRELIAWLEAAVALPPRDMKDALQRFLEEAKQAAAQ